MFKRIKNTLLLVNAVFYSTNSLCIMLFIGLRYRLFRNCPIKFANPFWLLIRRVSLFSDPLTEAFFVGLANGVLSAGKYYIYDKKLFFYQITSVSCTKILIVRTK